MTFRPSPLAYALAVVVAWLILLAIAVDRVELLLVATPLVLRLVRSPAPTTGQVHDVSFATDTGILNEGEELALAIAAHISQPAGPVAILPVLPAQAQLLEPLPARLPTLPGEQLHWQLRLLCRFGGMLEFGTIFLRQWDRSLLWIGEVQHELRASVAVYPHAASVQIAPIPRLTAAPFGTYTSSQLGDGSDFADIRRFAAGDRVRRINWPVSLRTRQLQVNQFHAERSAEVILLLDAFANVGVRPHSSLDHCLRAAAGLASLYLRSYNRVGLLAVGGWIRRTRSAAGPRQYANILQALTQITIVPDEFPQARTMLPETMLPRHALIIALTPLADERFSRIVMRLADQGRDVVLLAVRGDEMSLPLLPRRAADPLLRRLWLVCREERLRELRSHGVRASNWSVSQPLDAAIHAVQRPARRSATWHA